MHQSSTFNQNLPITGKNSNPRLLYYSGEAWQYDADAFRTWFLTEHGKNNALSIPVITRSMTTVEDDEPLMAPISRPIP